MDNTLALIANMDEKNLDFVQQVLNTYTRKALLEESQYVTHPTTYFVGKIDDEELEEET